MGRRGRCSMPWGANRLVLGSWRSSRSCTTPRCAPARRWTCARKRCRCPYPVGEGYTSARRPRRPGGRGASPGPDGEPRQLKHRGFDEVRIVPSPPELTALLRAHLDEHGTTPDGRLFRGVRGGPLSESLYGRVWGLAHTDALTAEEAASPLARRPYDLRHAAVSTWLNGGVPAPRSPPGLDTAWTSCSASTPNASPVRRTPCGVAWRRPCVPGAHDRSVHGPWIPANSRTESDTAGRPSERPLIVFLLVRGRSPRVWQVKDSNLRRLSRRIYSRRFHSAGVDHVRLCGA
jgi:hypothetical protein